MSDKIQLRELLLLILNDSSLQTHPLFFDLGRNRPISIAELKRLITKFIKEFLSPIHIIKNNNDEEDIVMKQEDHQSENKKINNNNNNVTAQWSVVALEIHDSFLLAVAEISCVLFEVPFLPLDPSDSTSYRKRQYELCGVIKVINQERDLKDFGKDDVELLPSYQQQKELQDDFDNVLLVVSSPAMSNNSAFSERSSPPLYLIFTSGSTVRTISNHDISHRHQHLSLPKCLVVDENNLMTYIHNICTSSFFKDDVADSNNKCDTPPVMNVMCLSSATFDPSIGDIFSIFYLLYLIVRRRTESSSPSCLSSCSSCTLVCPTKAQILSDVTESIRQAAESGFPITHTITSPALWKNVNVDNLIHHKMNSSTSSRIKMKVALGGEQFPVSLLFKEKEDSASKNDIEITIQYFSIYGLTEATVYQCLKEMKKGMINNSEGALDQNCSQLVGEPLNDEIKLLLRPIISNTDDDELQTRHQQEGELVIRSKQVVRGYLVSSFDDEKEIETVSLEPFENNTLFTGDLVRVRNMASCTGNIINMLLDELNPSLNTIELLGRLDFQVKISGRRVSLEDVERTVEVVLSSSSLIEKCICFLNSSKTGLIGVVSLKSTSSRDDNNSDDDDVSILAKVFRFVCNLSLRDREQLSHVHIWREKTTDDGEDCHSVSSRSRSLLFPVTKNGKTDRKKIAETVISSMMTTTKLNAHSSNNNDDSSIICQKSPHQQQHPMRIELEILVREIWSEALGIDQNILLSSSKSANFFILGGDSLLCVKVSRELLYAIFPDEADDRTTTTPKRRKRRGNLSEFLKNHRKNSSSSHDETNDNNNNQEDSAEENHNNNHHHQNLRVDEFGAFKGPVQPRVLMKFPTLSQYCDVLWKEICQFVSLSDIDHDDEKKNCSNNTLVASDGSSSSMNKQEASSSSLSLEIQEFTDLLSQSIDASNEAALSLLLNYKLCLELLDIDPSKQLGCSLIMLTGDNASSSTTSSSLMKNQNNKKGNNNNNSKPRIAFPLHHCIQNGDLKLVKLLTLPENKIGCKPTDFNLSSHVTALHVAAQNTTSETVLKFLVEEVNGPIQVRDSRFQSLLHYSARAGSLATTKWLIAKCMSIDDNLQKKDQQQQKSSSSSTGTKNNNNNNNKNHSDSTILLNSMILSRDRWQRTPLHWAIVNNHLDVVKCLVQEGEVKYFPSADRNPNQLLRLTNHRTALPYESPGDLAKRTYGEKSEMFEVVSRSKLN